MRMRSACGRRCSAGSAPVQAHPARPRRQRGAPRTPPPARATAGAVHVHIEKAPMQMFAQTRSVFAAQSRSRLEVHSWSKLLQHRLMFAEADGPCASSAKTYITRIPYSE